MRVAFGLFGVVAFAGGLVGCNDQAPNSAVAQPNPAAAKLAAPAAASEKSAIPAGKLTQVVLEVPGMT